MANPHRYVPRHTLAETILVGKKAADPRNIIGAMKYTQEMFRNGKKYELEVIYRELDNMMFHFHYQCKRKAWPY